MARLKIMLLGSFTARIGRGEGEPVRLVTRKSQALLAYLAMPAGRQFSRNVLSELLWDNVPASQARHSLRQALTDIRAALRRDHADLLHSANDTLSLDAGRLRVDVTTFERLLDRGTPQSVATAIRLYHGDFLAGLRIRESAFDAWLTTQRAHLRQRAIEAHEVLIRHLMMRGRADHAIDVAIRLLGMDPLLESAHRTLIRLYADTGRMGAAVQQYKECVRIVTTELGVGPEDDTHKLMAEIRRRRGAVSHAPESWALIQTRSTLTSSRSSRRRP